MHFFWNPGKYGSRTKLRRAKGNKNIRASKPGYHPGRTAGTGAGLYGDMAATGEKLVSWHRVFTPNPAHRELYQGMMEKWQSVYADQLGLVDSGLTTSMWQAPGLERRPPVVPAP